MDEKTLVAQAQAGDFAAFTELINRHKSKVYGLIRKLVGNPDDAADIVQDTFLKAIDKIDQFRGEASFGTWLTSIALNQARAQFNRNQAADLKPLEEYLPGGGAEHQPDGARLFDWSDPLSQLEAAEIRQIVGEGIETLPFKYREAFLLRYIEEKSVKEVAAAIGESEAATKSRILRARLALRDFLSKRFEDSYGQKV